MRAKATITNTGLGFLTVAMLCGLTSQAWGVEQTAGAQDGENRAQVVELGQPVGVLSSHTEAMLAEEPRAFQTASLTSAQNSWPPRASMGMAKLSGRSDVKT